MKPPTFDQRGAIIVGIFLLGSIYTAAILGIIVWRPELLNSASFMQLATLVITATLGAGGFGMVVNWAFGSTKSGSETAAKLADSVVTNPGTNPAPIDVTKPVQP